MTITDGYRLVWSERILWAVLNMTTNFNIVAINLNININLPARLTAKMRAGSHYQKVWLGEVNENIRKFAESVLKEADDRKKAGYDPNLSENRYRFDTFVPKVFNSRCLGCSVSGNGEMISVNRHYTEHNKVKFGRHWLEITKAGEVTAWDTQNTWFPAVLVPSAFKGGFHGWSVERNGREWILLGEDGLLYTTCPERTAERFNPGDTSTSHTELLRIVQELYTPEFVRGSELTGVSPTKDSWGKTVPAPDSLIVNAGGISLLVTSGRNSLEFGLGDYGEGRRTVYFSCHNSDERVKELYEWLNANIFNPNRNFQKFIKVLKDNGEKVLAKGLKLLAELCQKGTLDLSGMTVRELRYQFTDYPVFAEVFEEYSEQVIQIREGFLNCEPAPEGVVVTEAIKYGLNRAKRSERVIPLRDIMSPEDTISRGDVYPYENFVFEYNGKEISLDKVDLNEGKTLVQLESGDFYYGSPNSSWINDTLDHRYARDVDSGRLDDIYQFTIQQELTRFE